jgi:hypothetical protein
MTLNVIRKQLPPGLLIGDKGNAGQKDTCKFA